MALESGRSPALNNGVVPSRPKMTINQDPESMATRRTVSEGDIGDGHRLPLPAKSRQAQATNASQSPKLTSVVPSISVPTSTGNSAITRETSPSRPTARMINSTASSSSLRKSSRTRENGQDRSPSRNSNSQPGEQASLSTVTVASRALSLSSKPPLLSAPSTQPNSVDPPANDFSPEKSSMSSLPATRPLSEQEHPVEPNSSSKRSASRPSDDQPLKQDAYSRERGTSARRSLNGPGMPLETVQEMVSDPSTSSVETMIQSPTAEEPRLSKIEEDSSVDGSRHQNGESGSESGGGNKSSENRGESGRTQNKTNGEKAGKRSFNSGPSGNVARNKPADGSVRHTIVAETVSSIPQVSLGVGPGERGSSGRVDAGTLRMKLSNETIRPRKEKKKARKPAALSAGNASSKADIFEAKVASAVDEADVSDSDETFVYESNPPDPYPARQQHRYHSRTPSANSMASQFDQRTRPGLRDGGNQGVTGKRSMKFTNNTYNSSVDGDAADAEAGWSNPRLDGNASHTVRHHHIGRHGRNVMHPSLFDGESPFPNSQAPPHSKSPRHFIGNGYRQSRNTGSRILPNYHTMSDTTKKAGDTYSFDFDAEGADDERAPLIGSNRTQRNRYGRRPNSASLRQMEYMQKRQRSCFTRYGGCAIFSFILFAVFVVSGWFIIAVTKPLLNVQIVGIENVLASEQEIMLDLSVQAVNPNLLPVTIDYMDVNIFAKSRYVGTDKLWRNAQMDVLPRIERSRRRAQLAQLARSLSTPSGPPVHATEGVDKGTDPIPNDPVGETPTMLLGRVYHFDSPLSFEPSFWVPCNSTSTGQIRLARPGNKTEEGGSERWERVLQYPFELIVRGVVKYELPVFSHIYSASVSSSVKVIPGQDDSGHSGNSTVPSNNTAGSPITTKMSRPRSFITAIEDETGSGRALGFVRRVFAA